MCWRKRVGSVVEVCIREGVRVHVRREKDEDTAAMNVPLLPIFKIPSHSVNPPVICNPPELIDTPPVTNMPSL